MAKERKLHMSSLKIVASYSAVGGLRVDLTQKVVKNVRRYRQTAFWRREAGGQLFARISGDCWVIEAATGPRRSDIRSRFGFHSDRLAEQVEINALFLNELHYVGDWHTHPELTPTPSQTDLHSMLKMVRASSHELPGFLMLIVGTKLDASGFSLTMHRVGGGWETLPLITGDEFKTIIRWI
jgi:integrative and conjugative element protein (TIGR02256 family)